jgi:hypothetical protein
VVADPTVALGGHVVEHDIGVHLDPGGVARRRGR